MALAGRAFLALWNDIERTREVEYDQWHSLEHVPERVALDGFNGARRYVNRGRADHRYFTLYDVAALDVFEGAQYRDLLEHPTPWSAAMRPDFSNFMRVLCAVSLSNGTGIGGAIACLCVPPESSEDTLRSALDAAGTLPRVNAVHLGQRCDVGPAAPIAVAPGAPPPRPFDRVALIEALDTDAADDALGRVRHALDLRALPRDFGADVYDLALVFPSHDATARQRHRRAGW